jgi:hypothetical protein
MCRGIWGTAAVSLGIFGVALDEYSADMTALFTCTDHFC